MKVMQRLEAVISPSRPIGVFDVAGADGAEDGNFRFADPEFIQPARAELVVFQGENEPVLAGFPEGAFGKGADAAEVFAVLQDRRCRPRCRRTPRPGPCPHCPLPLVRSSGRGDWSHHTLSHCIQPPRCMVKSLLGVSSHRNKPSCMLAVTPGRCRPRSPAGHRHCFCCASCCTLAAWISFSRWSTMALMKSWLTCP